MQPWSCLVWCWITLAGILLFHQPAWGQAETRETAEASKPGVILLVEGIGGLHLMQVAGDIGFRQSGLPHEVRLFSWSHGFGRFLRDLQDIRHVQAKGKELADEILAIRTREPNRRIFLVAHSGGAGVAVRAAELLPPDSLERIVLLSCALSPEYDLRPALAASRQGVVSYSSPYDLLILAWGTRQFGTIDRVYAPSAGYEGFQIPEDEALYERLVQVPWSPRMIRQGNWGNHTGTILPSFLAGEVAKWLR